MIADGHLKIITKGNSRGNATVYQLIWKKLPNTVGEEQSLGEVELPNSDTPNSPTMEPQLPNATPYHPSYTSVLSTTKSDETAVAVVALSEAVARRWWEKQRVKPLGQGAWHSLLQITKAAEARGYSEQQIEQALDYIGTVPTMRQMDLVLRGVGVKTKHEQSAIRAIDLAEKFRNDSI
jgi:hypothetical protein